ncbi:MAG: CRISPR system precrRNA processing endoribonuclease RAMP protein Cas6 [Candidatus Thorarchaeota archaeon]|nr:CRISPR system precrRNA processing endoribonuclease RAMP protein Cas6 [Candidatus Thorarchaeota archaeon]
MIELQFQVLSPVTGNLGFTGTPLRAAFLNLINDCDDELSNQIHDSRAIRTYALQPFGCGADYTTTVRAGEEYRFRVNLLDSDRFQDIVRKFALGAQKSLRIHHEVFPILRVDFNAYDAGKTMETWFDDFKRSFKDEVHLVVHYLTPTQLSAYGSDFACLFPQPERVFSSLLRVWNQIEHTTSLERVSEYRDWLESRVYVSGYRLHTAQVSLGRNRSVVGFVGRVVYTVTDARSPLGLLTAGLAKFAEISNIGKNRTAGFGQVEVRIEHEDHKEVNRTVPTA